MALASNGGERMAPLKRCPKTHIRVLLQFPVYPSLEKKPNVSCSWNLLTWVALKQETVNLQLTMTHVSSLDDLPARKAHPTADLLDWSHNLVHLAVLKAKGLFWWKGLSVI